MRGGRSTRHVVAILAILLLPVQNADAQTFELLVKKDHLIGSSQGTLVFTPTGLEYRTSDSNDARLWSYADVKQLQVLSPTKVRVLTYEDQGGLRFGADRTFEFEVLDGTVSAALIEFLLDHVDRPFVTAVLPTANTEPSHDVQVKHLKGRGGSHGNLQLYRDRLVFATDQAGQSRAWRFHDLYLILRVDSYKLKVLAYEGGGGATRTFTFELKEELPESFIETVWWRIHSSGSG